MMGPGQHGPGDFGDMRGEEMEKRGMEMEKKQQERMLKDMKRGMSQMTKFIGPFEKKVAAVEKKGVQVPQSIKDIITKVKELTEQIKNATEPEVAMEAGEDLREIAMTMQDSFQILEQLGQMNQILKQVNTEIKRLDGRYKAAVTKSKRIKGDVSEILATAEVAISDIKTSVEEVRTLMGQGSAEEAFALLESMREKFDDADEKIGVIDAVLGVTKFIRQADQEVKAHSTAIARAKRKGEDVTEAVEALNQVKLNLAAVKKMSKGKVDMDDLVEAMESLHDSMGQLDDVVNVLFGKVDDEFIPGFSGEKVKVPSSILNILPGQGGAPSELEAQRLRRGTR